MGLVPWGGSEELWVATALQFLERGDEVTLSVPDWPQRRPKLEAVQRRGATVLQRYHFRAGWRRALACRGSSYAQLLQTDPDVLIVSQGNSFDVLDEPDLAELLLLTPVPFIMICQFNDGVPCLPDESSRRLAIRLFSRAFRVLFVSDHNRLAAEKQMAYRLPNADLVRNPVNLSDSSYVTWPESATARFACVARLDAQFKGQDLLLEALGSSAWTERDWHLSLYGAGPDEGYFRALVKLLGLESKVSFEGHVQDVRSIWAREQVLVLTSRAEGIPLALVEAMLCGRPAVVTRVGGNAEWIEDARNGILAEAADLGLVKDALERAWAARGRWELLGRDAHQTAVEKAFGSPYPPLLTVADEAAGTRLMPHDRLDGELSTQYRALVNPSPKRRLARLGRGGLFRLKDVAKAWLRARRGNMACSGPI